MKLLPGSHDSLLIFPGLLMTRSARLLDLLQILRRSRYPVPGAALASELGISLRTLYRDIATLQAQGACIDGAPGLGYVLQAGFTLPPLMFSEEEIEALVLGSRWVTERTDPHLALAARNALAKIAAVLPDELRDSLDATTLLIGPSQQRVDDEKVLATIRQAIRQERMLSITYRALSEKQSCRIIWPFALGFFDQVRLLLGWCTVREDFRNFRTDRIIALDLLDKRIPRRRQSLLKEWRDREKIAAQ